MTQDDSLKHLPPPEAVRAELHRHIQKEAGLRALLRASQAAQEAGIEFSNQPGQSAKETGK